MSESKNNESSSKPTDGAKSESQNSLTIVRTVKVSNISMKTDKAEIKEFLSFSGDIHHVELQRESDMTQLAFVTYKDPQRAQTALCLSGATLSNLIVTITPVEDYRLPPDAPPLDSEKNPPSSVHKAKDVVTSMLAGGFVLGKDALEKAKDFDEQHQVRSKASDRAVSVDHKTGFSEKAREVDQKYQVSEKTKQAYQAAEEKATSARTAANEKAREVDQKYQVSEKTKHAYEVAEEKASNAGTAIKSNDYVMTGAASVSNACSAVAKTAEDISAKAKEKVENAELERQEKLAAMSPKTRGKVEKAEQEKAPEKAKANAKS